jgi:hypothetical protein
MASTRHTGLNHLGDSLIETVVFILYIWTGVGWSYEPRREDCSGRSAGQELANQLVCCISYNLLHSMDFNLHCPTLQSSHQRRAALQKPQHSIH